MTDETGGPAIPEAPRPIGELLLNEGAVSKSHLEKALSLQARSGARVGDILTARGWTDPSAILRAVAAQRRTTPVDLRVEPPDEALFDDGPVDAWLRGRMLPWRRAESGGVIFVSDDPSRARRETPDALIRLAAPSQMERALTRAVGRAEPRRAADRTPSALSARGSGPRWRRAVTGVLSALLLAWLALSPGAALTALFVTLAVLSVATAGLRIAALAAMIRHPSPPPQPDDLSVRRPPPRIAVLIALLREPDTMPILIEALEALDWPRELLEVKLILEEDDAETLAAIEALKPPAFIRTVIAPPGDPRTKPRALNVALDLCEADIIGVYDAEDRPDPDQLRKVAEMFRAQGPDLAAVQCRLTAFNARENILTRLFTLEYAIWFDLLLPGMRRLGMPVPLGGTSVFFRRTALERLGGWDAHNVTEDADLGVRLARMGMRAEFCDSVTEEEATIRPGAWLRQRSRWMKGFVATWLVHMRRPFRALRDFGAVGLFAVTCMLPGAVATSLFAPVMVLIGALILYGWGPDWAREAMGWPLALLASVQAASWASLLAAAVAACKRRERKWLTPWALLLPFYWLATSIAAAIAMIELALAPTHWRKTRHGAGEIAKAERAAALARRAEAARRAAG